MTRSLCEQKLQDAEIGYPELEKLALALVVASRKSRPYFHEHLIEVLTSYTLRQVLQKLEASGRLLKWAIELGKFDVNFRPRTTIKRQALANFIAEFTYTDAAEVARTAENAEAAKVTKAQEEKSFALMKGDAVQWTLYVDDTSNDTGSDAGMMLISPEGHKIHYALHFRLKASNNEAEYEALTVGLHLAKELQARSIQIYSDTQLVVNQVNDVFVARGDRMVEYLEKEKGLMETFLFTSIEVFS